MTRARQLFVELAIGAVVMAASVVVWVLNQDTSTDILAGVGFAGGVAVIVNALPTNNGKSPPTA